MSRILTDHMGRCFEYVRSSRAQPDDVTDLGSMEYADNTVHVVRVLFPGTDKDEEKTVDVKVRLSVPWVSNIIPVGAENFQGVTPAKMYALLVAAGEAIRSSRIVIYDVLSVIRC